MTDARALIDALTAALPAAARDRAGPPRLAGGRASVILDVTGLDAAAQGALRAAVEAALAAVPGVTAVRVALTAERRALRLVAVASGKGGVGKSTLAANLAVALVRAGHRAGLIDADIHGPSQPRLMGTESAQPVMRDGKLVPVIGAGGVPMLSVGHLVPPDKAIAWRGAMVGKALGQLLEGDWSGCDVVVVDLPPGTGDIQLSMITRHRPAGAVVVSTPQDLALIEARRAIDLFAQVGVPVIGLVENMAGYVCPACGVVSDPFGSGGTEQAAAALGLPFLGRIPLDMAIRIASDAGQPPAAGNDPVAQPFAVLAARVADWLRDH